MLIKKSYKALLFAASLVLLAACATPNTNGSGGAGGNGAGGNGATSTGVGQMSSFGPSNASNPMQVGNQSYYFDFNQSDVQSGDQASIKVQANYLIAHPNAKVRLEGNTDVRGSREYNIGLGNRRALAVASVLEMDGVSKNQITTVSYGAEKPVALGNDDASYAKNRRVDLIFTTPVN